MAESAVNLLVEKISFLLEEEVKLLSGFREEVASVKAELESTRASLRAADALEDEDEEIKAWVKQVRDVAFDAEDILDEYLYRFADQHRQRQGFYGCLFKIAQTVKSLKARHKIATELGSIKLRATEISYRRQRYLHKPNVVLEQGESSTIGRKTAWQERRHDARLLQESQLVGIGERKQKLVNCLLDGHPSSVQLVAVVGMGGLGKTTLVNQIYIDANVKAHFQHRAWVTVSRSFNPCVLLQKIIQQLFDAIKQPLPQGANSSDRYDLSQIIINFLSEERYLVVLDDVWDVNAWNDLKYAFPNNNRASRLMLTTRIGNVASTATKDFMGDNVYPIKSLSREESWELFCARTFQGKSCPPHLIDISHHILRRCMGLPLAIVTIGGVLATKDTSKLSEWEMISRNLGPEFDSNDQLANMKKILSLSFSDLSYSLKSCFLFLSIFPEDWRFLKNRIIELWVAEGFVRETKDTTLEDVGELYFNELYNRSLIQIAVEDVDEKLNEFQVHDLVREIMLEKSKDQNFAATVGEQNPILQERVRHLSIFTGLEKLPGNLNLSKLRSLFLSNVDGSISSTSMSTFFSKHGRLRLLKVLYCATLPLDTFPKCVTKLYNLRYLNLYGTKVASIPRSIGRLRNLETLDLGETLVKELTTEILQLHHLRHIRAFHTIDKSSRFKKYAGVSVPTEIGKLTSLQSLWSIEASKGGIDLIRSLGNLKQLRWLEVQQLRAEHGPALCSSIEKLSQLRDSLRMITREEAELLDVQAIASPPQHLQRLSMYGRLEMMPHWVPMLSNLQILHMGWSKLYVDPLESIEALPNLVTLLLDDAYDGEELCVKAGGFLALKELTLCSLGRLRQVRLEQGAMPHVQQLWLEDCKLLKEVPSGVEFLTELKQLLLISMGDQLLTRLYSSSQNSDLSRVKHVPKVFLGSRDAEGVAIGRYLEK